MGDLLELAARCEAATGPDRELDAAISAADGKHGHLSFETPRYTASLDAAMQLVPEGMIVCVTNCGIDDPHSPNLGRGTAIVGEENCTATKPTEAASMALSLCAAALRARAASTHRDEVREGDR